MKKIRKFLKRFILVILVLLVIVIGALFAIPYFFKDELLEATKKTINEQINAKVDFSDVNLSLFRSFPDFNFRLDSLQVVGLETFEGVKLASIQELELSFDLMSVIKSDRPIAIKSVHLGKPEIDIRVLKSGKANYDIAKPTTDTTTTSQDESEVAFEINLQKYSIANGYFRYDDQSSDVFLEIMGLDHEGRGDFTQDIYDLNTQTNISGMTVKSGGIAYLKKAALDLKAIINADMPNMKFTLKDNDLSVNAMRLIADGFVQMEEDNINMDLKVDAPKNDFKNLLSLIPSAYTKEFEGVQADGKFQLTAQVNGTYNGTTGALPPFAVKLGVDQGNFKYPALPLGINNIQTKIQVNSPSSNLDKMTVDIPLFKMKLGNNPFDATFNLKTPISDPDVKTEINGTIDLEDLSNAFPMEGMEALKGIITANLKVNTRMSTIEREDYENVEMAGDLRLQNMDYKAEGMPSVFIADAQLDFSPQYVNLSKLDSKLGKSDLKASGRIDNILAWISPEKTMTGTFVVRSEYFDANEWMTEEAESAPQPSPQEPDQTETAEVFDQFDFTLDAAINTINYDIYNITGVVAKGHFTPERFEFSDFRAKIGESDFQVTGTLKNVFDYAFDNQTLTGAIAFNSSYLNLNQFMVPESDGQPKAKEMSGEEALEPIVIPDNIDLDITANIGRLDYTDIQLRDMRGAVVVENREARLENVVARGLGGTIALAGGYNTQDPEDPKFDFKYDLQNILFGEAFNALNTFQTLAPIGKYINGRFSTNMIMSGALEKDLTPKYNTLNVTGFLETINAMIENFKPLGKVAGLLNLESSNKFPIKGTKNWFEVKNGRLELQEFDYMIKDIAMKIGGGHGLVSGMDYLIKAKVPRKYIENNPAGSALKLGADWLGKEASKLGVPIKQGEFVNLNINLTGTMEDPKIGVKFVGMDGQTSVQDAAKEKLKEEAEKKLQEAEDKAREEAEKLKQQEKEEADKKLKDAQDKAKKEAEKAAQKAKEEAEKKLKEEAAKKAKEEAERKAKEEAEKLKEKVDKWNPFGKKKEGGG